MPDIDPEDEDAGAPAEQQPIPLPAVAPEHFDLIIEWCTHEVENKSTEQEKNAWNKQYFSAMDDATILAIITVSEADALVAAVLAVFGLCLRY